MKRVSRDHYDSRDPIRSIYQGGLKGVFATCQDPLPDKMEKLIQRLKDDDQRDGRIGLWGRLKR
jgi:hypothetical protein